MADMYIIYKTTNLINGKIYIGKHNGNKEDYLGSGKILKLAIEKYGKENFKREVLEYVDYDSWIEREIYWIKELKSQDHNIGYNILSGGQGTINFTHSEKTKKIISEKAKKRVTNEFRKKVGDQFRGIVRSVDSRNKQSESISGEKNCNFGKKFTKDHIKKIKQFT